MGIFALLVNPKDGAPYYSELLSGNEVEIRALDGARGVVGEGYFNSDINNQYGSSSRITGLPRAHTPTGVKTKGGGLGTVLYTGLCAAAHQEFTGELTIRDLDVSGDGISSNSHRSGYATTWWERAKDQYGLAEVDEGCAESEFEETLRGRDDSTITSFVEYEKGLENVTLSRYRLEVEGTAEECGLEADAYPYTNATKANLVVARCEGDKRLFKSMALSAFDLESRDALAAVNMGALRDYSDDMARDIAVLLVNLARHWGLPADVIEGMQTRFLLGADIDPTTWTYPDFEAYHPVRQNPTPVRRLRVKGPRGRARTLGVKVTPPTLFYPKRLPPARLKYYTKTRPNPPRDPKLARAIAQVHELRARLGWGVFAADTTTR